MILQLLFFILGYAGHIFRDYERYKEDLNFKEYIILNSYDISNTAFMSVSLFLVYVVSMDDQNPVNSFLAGYAGESGLRYILKRWGK
jgi:hypothetical protein